MAESIRGTLLDNFGRPISGATVTVYKTGTSNLASLYSDYALTLTVGNPLTTEADGSYLAFAPNGIYDLVLAKTGVTFDSTDSIGEVLFDNFITRTVVTTGTLSENDYIVALDATGASFTFNLMALSTINEGRSFILFKKDSTANTITIDPSGAETINGAATLVLGSAKQGVVIAKVGTEWQTYQPPAQTTSGAGKIPLGRSSDGKLDSSWGGAATSLATLDASAFIPLAQIPAILTGKDADTVDGKNPGSANGLATLDASTLVPLVQIPTPLTGKTATNADNLLADGSYRTASNAPTANQIPVLNATSNLALPSYTIVPNNSGYTIKTAAGTPLFAISRDTSNRLIIGDGEANVYTSSLDKFWHTGIRPVFGAYAPGSQSPTSGVATKITLNTEIQDSHGYFDSTTNYRFTPLSTGTYFFAATLRSSFTTSMTNLILILYKNGSVFRRLGEWVGSVGAGVPVMVGGSTADIANGTTDYYEVYVITIGTGTATVWADTNFIGVKEW